MSAGTSSSNSTVSDRLCKLKYIKKPGKLRSAIEFQVEKIEETKVKKSTGVDKEDIYYTKLLIKNGNTKMEAICYGQEDGRRILDICTEHSWYRVLSGGAEAKKTMKKYTSASNSNFYIILQNLDKVEPIRRQGSAVKCEDINKSIDILRQERRKNIHEIISHFRINDGKVRRYLGCGLCKKGIRRPNAKGKYVCPKKDCTNYEKEVERKLYYCIDDITICKNGQEIPGIFSYHDDASKIMKTAPESIEDDKVATEEFKANCLGKLFAVDLVGKVYNGSWELVFKDLRILEVRVCNSTDSRSFGQSSLGFLEPGKLKIKIHSPRIPYQIRLPKPGVVLIINNVDFDGNLYREGAEIDEHHLKDFYQQRGFQVIVKRNFESASAFWAYITGFLEDLVQYNADSLIVYMMSHGSRDMVHMLNKDAINKWKMVYQFRDNNCAPLLGKPKIFFFNSCEDTTTELSSTTPNFGIPNFGLKCPDTLVCNSTLPYQVSNRLPGYGSFFIQEQLNVFNQYASSGMDMLDMLNIVQRILSERPCTQTPVWCPIIFDRFVFPSIETETTNA